MTRLVALTVLLVAAPASSRPIADARDQVVKVTLDYLNVPYLWGGEHPKTGMDCSGFVQLVYRRAGLSLPRVARDQYLASSKLAPSGVLPGDLVFFSMKRPGSSRVDHVGIYVGRGHFIHASVTNGIHIEAITNPYYLSRLVAIRKYRGF